MAEIALSAQHTQSGSIGNMLPPTMSAAPEIEVVKNPDFSFPRLQQNSQEWEPITKSPSHRRPVSINMDSVSSRPQTADAVHKNTGSKLPSFNFHPGNATGLHGQQETEPEPSHTHSRNGHKRTKSEYGGGFGVPGAISSSPTRSSVLQVPQPGSGRGHAHRRSQGVSSHDLAQIMRASDPSPRLSSSLPNTPLEHPSHPSEAPVVLALADPFIAPDDDASARPPSRPRVEFSENVEYIPRPLSTISSETESSLSTIRGHSVNNSISSVLSLSTPSPPSSRARGISLGTTLEHETRSMPKSSLDISKRVEKEGEWLKHGSSTANVKRAATQSVADSGRLTFAVGEGLPKSRTAEKKRHLKDHSLGFDRRRSEPAIGMHAGEPSRLSALSLQEPASHAQPRIEEDEYTNDNRRSSTRRIKDWAVSKITRRTRPQSECILPRHTAPSDTVQPVAETDLDAVFNMDVDDVQSSGIQVPPLASTHTPSISHQSSFDEDSEDIGMMLDLDAALGPFKTPALGVQKPRKQLHSFNHPKETFTGPGLHYQPFHHGRTLSAPALAAFDQIRTGTPPLQPMADVFEEEEEDELAAAKPLSPSSTSSGADETAGMGVSIVDQDESAQHPTASQVSPDDGLGIHRSAWEPERPTTSYGNLGSRLSTHGLERRASSIIDQTIVEETSPVDSVAIVNDYEEPRAHSLTKSSDSSEAPTILAAPGMLSIPDGDPSLTTPETYHSSAFSSPDFARRKGSFETSRVGTSASSITTDNRTMSSYTTGEPAQDNRVSTDDVPSLTSSRSTMISTMHANSSRRDVSGIRTPSLSSGHLDPAVAAERRRKRTSIQSLSQLVGGSFGPRNTGVDNFRPQTAIDATVLAPAPKKKEHRLKKLMFWKSKNRQASTSTIS
ncbi:uncharacterized protein MYCFIDRAFT_213028 [Pseudocercospora fijiensis CIRAD86]|uniref:Cell wall proline rich protein n=1 Tax=Pseudocercospora fijiensis (strain CIRAD86) TaxID=383855 RepID=N1Q6B9_PSEFD|nr:uncharacterized protein MYCFIDRAFT_213028 [Pseudocercospora fijiensis CIRAD86]EME87819.1 hypothetical protein MYCFIDRAFT_213028 [Pseudocercospora fijiensis CIRAD86]